MDCRETVPYILWLRSAGNDYAKRQKMKWSKKKMENSKGQKFFKKKKRKEWFFHANLPHLTRYHEKKKIEKFYFTLIEACSCETNRPKRMDSRGSSIFFPRDTIKETKSPRFRLIGHSLNLCMAWNFCHFPWNSKEMARKMKAPRVTRGARRRVQVARWMAIRPNEEGARAAPLIASPSHLM